MSLGVAVTHCVTHWLHMLPVARDPLIREQLTVIESTTRYAVTAKYALVSTFVDTMAASASPIRASNIARLLSP